MQSLIIDCDPGQDDAVNLLLAFAAPEAFDILGVTTVAGNVPLDMAARNARIIRELAGREDVPVYAGCTRALLRPPLHGHHVHGPTGLDGMALFDPRLGLAPGHGVDFIERALLGAEDDTVLITPTGPLTNLALAIVKNPLILPKIKRIVLMGGAMREGGNITPSAEFNIAVDPHAAQIVLECGRPITMIGLDATHQALCAPPRLAQLQARAGRVGEAVTGMLSFFNRFDSQKYGVEGAPLHDPCTVAFLLAPGLFETKAVHVAVETASPLTLGHTAVDFWGVGGRPPNVDWVHKLDADGLFELIADRIARL